jgi:hypothetical protein
MIACTLYCQTHLDQCKPGASGVAWYPASPFVAIILSLQFWFAPKEQTFVTKPILSSGTITSPKHS